MVGVIFCGNLLMQGKEVECDGNLLIPLILSFDQLTFDWFMYSVGSYIIFRPTWVERKQWEAFLGYKKTPAIPI